MLTSQGNQVDIQGHPRADGDQHTCPLCLSPENRFHLSSEFAVCMSEKVNRKQISCHKVNSNCAFVRPLWIPSFLLLRRTCNLGYENELVFLFYVALTSLMLE
jgi:hypothetical protein